MASRNQVTLTFAGDDQSLSRTFSKVNRDADHFGRNLDKSSMAGHRFGGALKKVGIGALALGGTALTGLGAALKFGIDQMNQQAVASAQTAAVLKSTGGAAHVTQAQIEGLASSLQTSTGVADDAIQANENMLLTFTNVKNAVGKGNDVFNQATKTVLDMSQALGQSGKTSAIQLGKALNDPIKGVGALSKVGVTFTEGQKKSIKAMVDSGNTMGAQKVILKELNKEFGGSAKAFGDTFPGQVEKTKRAFENVAQSLAAAVLPSITKALQFVTSTVIPALQSLVDWGKAHWPQFVAAIKVAVDWIKTNVVPPVRAAFNAVKDIITGVVNIVIAIWHKFGSDIVNVVRTNFTSLVNVIKPVIALIQSIFKTFAALLHGDWAGVWNGLKGIVSNALKAVLAIITGLVNNFLAAARLLGHAVWEGILAGLKALAGLASKLVQGIGEAIKTAAAWVLTTAVSIGKALMEGIWNGFMSLKDWIISKVKGVLGSIKDAVLGFFGIHSPSQVMADEVGKPLMEGIAKGITNNVGKVTDAVKAMVKKSIEDAKVEAANIAAALADTIAIATANRLNVALRPSQLVAAGFQGQIDASKAIDTGISQRRGAEDVADAVTSAKSALGELQKEIFYGGTVPQADLDAATRTLARAEEDYSAFFRNLFVTSSLEPAVAASYGTTPAPATYQTSVTVNGANLTPTQIIALVDQYERRNGQRFARA